MSSEIQNSLPQGQLLRSPTFPTPTISLFFSRLNIKYNWQAGFVSFTSAGFMLCFKIPFRFTKSFPPSLIIESFWLVKFITIRSALSIVSLYTLRRLSMHEYSPRIITIYKKRLIELQPTCTALCSPGLIWGACRSKLLTLFSQQFTMALAEKQVRVLEAIPGCINPMLTVGAKMEH